MKNLMLIDIGLLNNFWAKIIKTANYFQNKFFIKNKNHSKIIPKKFIQDSDKTLATFAFLEDLF